jgi:hypothetical protein
MSVSRRVGWVVAGILALSGVAGAAAGCSGGSASNAGSGGGGASSPAVRDGVVAGVAAAGATLAPQDNLVHAPASAEPVLQAPQVPSAVIKTADVALRVDHGRFGAALRQVRAIADRFGGFVSRSSASGTGAHTGSLTLRVPAAAFGRTLSALEGVGKVTSETVAGQDVTQQFVDLHARLVNLRAQEQVLLRLMGRAQTIAESIRVENYLQNVEFQIEDAQGRILYLQNRTSMSTIAVVLREAGAHPVVVHHASSLWKAGARSLSTAGAVLTAVIVGAGFVVPVGILALIALVVGRRVVPLASSLAGRRAAGPAPSGEG